MMFHFANPEYLLLAVGVPPLIWWWLHQRGGALRYPATRSAWPDCPAVAASGLAMAAPLCERWPCCC